jgi:hypothetical protein
MTVLPFDATAWIGEARRLGYVLTTAPDGGGLCIEYPDRRNPFSVEERRLWLACCRDADPDRVRRGAIIAALLAEART